VDGVDRRPTCDDNDLDPAIATDTLDRGAEKPLGALQLRPHTSLEVRGVSVCLR
jgi:hypothetical protein